jgi:hypothetical protein
MKKRIEELFIRNFILPFLLTFTSYMFLNEIHSIKEAIIYFSVVFTLNWFLDKTIVQWNINQGKKIKEKRDKNESTDSTID